MVKKSFGIEDQVQNLVIGGVAGGITHHIVGMLRVEMEKQSGKRIPSPHGKELGPIVMMASMFFPESKEKYLATGFGAGMTLDDLCWHFLEEMRIKPLELNQTGEIDIIDKYSKYVHIEETLPAWKKEEIIFPMFPQIIEEQRENPMQTKAIERVKGEINLSPDVMTLMDCYWLQQFFFYWGKYLSSEGLTGGHDRFRTLAKLLRVRDSGKIMKNGHPAFYYDCDCGSISTNQIIDSYGYNVFFGLISQYQETEDGIFPAHHIFPVIEGSGRLWIMETIKELPIVPIEYLGRLFKNLSRVVLVQSNGDWSDYEDWRDYMKPPNTRRL
jgi:hypothetical protein